MPLGVSSFGVPGGRWKFPAGAGERHDLLGLLIVQGLLCREVALRDRHMLELLGSGDILQVPLKDGRPRLGGEIVITAVTEAEALALGRAFAAAGGRWPCLLAALHRRLEVQRERLAVQGLITLLPRAEHRVLLALWHLADRWGQVTPAGIVLPLPLTHDVLGQLTGARRSTTTIAASELQSEGLIERLDDGSWLLTTAAEARVEAITRTSPTIRALGDLLRVRQRINDTQQDARALHGEARHVRRQRHR